MDVIKSLKNLAKRSLNFLGYDIISIQKKKPQSTLLGLKNIPIKTIIDVGTNEGQFAKMVENIFPDAKIYSFEPLPEPYKKLEILGNNFMKGKLKSFNLALGDFEGFIEMFYHKKHSTSLSFLKTTNTCEAIYPFTKEQEPVQVKMSTLDKCVKDFDIALEPEVLIKLDVQGYEDRVIRGVDTFKMAKECILEVCLDPLYEGQADFKMLNDMLYNLGFRYAGNLNQSYGNDGHVIYIDAVFVK